MRIAVTGASGQVGHFIARAARAAGHQVVTWPGWRLGQPAALDGCDALVHAAFAHAAGKYRGGEGDDPAGFVAANLDGAVALFHDARAAGIGRAVFLSSRAVYDGYPAGTPLPDGTPARPANLYGRVKRDAEDALAALDRPGFATTSLRATGIYGPGPLRRDRHKWDGLFADYLAGRPISPRVATELHGDDLAAAVLLVLERRARGTFNASDLILDRHDLLAQVAALTGCTHPPPPRADTAGLSVMSCGRLERLGWRPGGMGRLRQDLRVMLPVV